MLKLSTAGLTTKKLVLPGLIERLNKALGHLNPIQIAGLTYQKRIDKIFRSSIPPSSLITT
jgi:hypothetical protein